MIFKKDFNGFKIDFEPFVKERSVMVNATQMAKAFDKRIDHFLRSDHAKEFISVLEFTPYGGNSEQLSKAEIIQTRGQAGTWMHRILALKFAAWLNPEFELWVFMVIEELLFGDFKRQTKSIERSVLLQTKIKALEAKPEKTGQDFINYLEYNNELKGEKNGRTKATKDKFKEAWDLFNPKPQE